MYGPKYHKTSECTDDKCLYGTVDTIKTLVTIILVVKRDNLWTCVIVMDSKTYDMHHKRILRLASY